MEIILTQDVENLGLEFDIVNVKPGYARNFLIPQGSAKLATPQEKENLNKILKEREAEEKALIDNANQVVAKLKEIAISIKAKVGSGDKLFGSINNQNLSEELAKQGIEIEKKYIKIPGNTIKRIGKAVAKIRLHRTVEHDYEFEVVAQD
ncbi:MAG: 50S ribosomal protein L9 [Flavobacteriales bacterium]|nr:50S ribosomal protein L9 [Flavobacteriales bacterium]